MSWNYGQEGPIGTITFKSNGPGPNFRFIDSDVNLVGTSSFNSSGSGSFRSNGYSLQTAPSPWVDAGNGNLHGWNGTVATIVGSQSQQGSSNFNVLSASAITADYAGTVATQENRFYTDTSAFNYTGKIRASMNEVYIQTTTGSTVTRPEPLTGITVVNPGADGTLTSGYGTAGELFHQSDTYVITAFWSLFGTTQLQANGNCTTGYGGVLQCLTDATATGTATGTFTTAYGAYGEVTHAANATIINSNGLFGITQNTGVGTIATARGVFGQVTNTSSGLMTAAFGIETKVTNTGTGTITAWQGVTVDAPTVSAGHAITTTRGIRVSNQGATGVTSALGIMVDVQTGASAQNVNLCLGSQPGSLSWNIYASSTAANALAGPMTLGATSAPDTNSILHILATENVATAAGAVWKALNMAASTVSLTGTTHVTTATGFNFAEIAQPTITGSQVAIDYAASLAIKGPPIAAGSVAFGVAPALWVSNAIATASGGSTNPAISIGIAASNAAAGLFWGSAAPAIVAPQGSLYIRTDGANPSTRMYLATNAAGSWTSLLTLT